MFIFSIIVISGTIKLISLFMAVSAEVLRATPLICNGKKFYDFSWNEDIHEDDVFDIIEENMLQTNCSAEIKSTSNMSSIILPGKVSFPGYSCTINPRLWTYSTLSNIVRLETNSTNINVTESSQRLCKCAPNTLNILEICSNGTHEVMVKFEENSTTYFNEHRARMMNVISGQNYTLRGDYQYCSFRLTIPRHYQRFPLGIFTIFINFIDEDRTYCKYENVVTFSNPGIKQCEECEPSNLRIIGMESSNHNNSIYSIEYAKLDSRIYEINRVQVNKRDNRTVISDLVIQETVSSPNGHILVHIPMLNKNVDYQLHVFFQDKLRKTCCYREYINITTNSVDVQPVSDSPHVRRNVLFAVMGIFSIAGIVLYLKKPQTFKCTEFLKTQNHSDFDFSNSRSTPVEVINVLYRPLDFMEIDPENIELLCKLGEGHFAEVYAARVSGLSKNENHRMVAIKQLKAKDEEKEFLKEIEIMKKIGKHENIVHMLAFVTKSTPNRIIMELILAGNLRDYLHMLRRKWTNVNNETAEESGEDGDYVIPDTGEEKMSLLSGEEIRKMLEELKHRPKAVLNNDELENFALQIAKGMAHLEKLEIVHRDLAARNILVTTNKELKISDFGLSRTGIYQYQSPKPLPMRWMAIEALKDYKVDTKSDVWSYGIVLWEIGTLGALPYTNLDNDYLLQYLISGKRLNRPEICTDDIFEIMCRCWYQVPQERPSFKELVHLLTNKRKTIYYKDFSKINSNYVFPPVR